MAIPKIAQLRFDLQLRLEDRPIVAEAIQTWIAGPWTVWSVAEAPRRRTIALYQVLYKIFQLMEIGGAESPIELMWGVGVVRWSKDGRIVDRPLLERRVEIELDDGRGGLIRIRPTSADAVFDLKPYEELGCSNLASLSDMIRREIQRIGEDEGVSPFTRESFEPILSAAGARLDPEGVYAPDTAPTNTKQDTQPGSHLTVTDKWVLIARPRSQHVVLQDSAAQVAEIAGSIRSFGFANPILVGKDGDLIAGHGRLATARQLGLAQVPVIVLGGLSDLQRRQLVLADNRIALNAGWDLEMLKLELADLKALGADLSALGFDTKELAAAFGQDSGGLTDENQIPDAQEIAVAAPGDIWCLGPHRIACADSTDANAVTTLLAGCHPQLMVTDPPYGVEYDPEWRHRIGVNKSVRRGKIKNDERADWTETWTLSPGEIAYVWHGALHSSTVAESLVSAGFAIRSQIIWAKERLVMSRGDYHWQHEPCWYAVRKKGNWTGDRKQTTLWEIPSVEQDVETRHATQKPVECMRRPMLNNSSPGQAVYEPFLGSGTTLIAAQTCSRVCYGVEIDPLFVDVAIRRWQAFTGEMATRLHDGTSFAVVAERCEVPSGQETVEFAVEAKS